MRSVGYLKALAVVFIFGGLFSGAESFACPETPVRLISDFDDTIKITNTLNKLDAGWNMLYSHDFFAGAPEFLQGYAIDNCAELDVLSGGWDAFSKYTISDLKANNITYDWVHERPNLDISIYDFKSSQLWESHFHTSEFTVLDGDDTQTDPQVLNDFMVKFPGQVLAAYIHVVTGRVLPSTVIPYYTNFEKVLMEHVAGRASEKTVTSVAQAILNNKNTKTLFPKYAKCPESPSDFSYRYLQSIQGAGPGLGSLALQVNRFVTRACVERNHSPSLVSRCLDILMGTPAVQN